MRAANRRGSWVVGVVAVCSVLLPAVTGCATLYSEDGARRVADQSVPVSPVIGDVLEVRAGANTARIKVSNLRRVDPGPLDRDESGRRDHYAVTVVIATTAGTWSANPLYLEFVSDKGAKGDRFASAVGVDELPAGPVPEGRTVSADVITSVPVGERIQRVSTGQLSSPMSVTWLVR